MSRRGLGAQAALLAILALAACGGGSEEAQGDGGISEADVEDAGLGFARCEHGIDVPDPRSGPPSGGSGQGAALGDLDLDDPRVQEAMEACAEQGPGLRPAE